MLEKFGYVTDCIINKSGCIKFDTPAFWGNLAPKLCCAQAAAATGNLLACTLSYSFT